MIQLISRFICLSLLFSSLAHASALIGLDYILFTDKNTVETNTSATSSKSMYSINIQFSLTSKKNFYFGWAMYNVATKDDVNEQKSNYSTADMGPSFRFEFGRNGLYFVNFTYGISTKTSYDSGSTADTWLGTNYLFQLGVNPEIGENLNAAFTFNYFSGSAAKKVVSDVQSSVSYSKAFMTPTIGIVYKW